MVMKYGGSFRSFFGGEDAKESQELEHFSSKTFLPAAFALSCDFPFFAWILRIKAVLKKNNL